MKSHLLAVVLCISPAFVCAANCAAQNVPPDDQWGDQHNSAGASLKYVETERKTLKGLTFVAYNLFASGMPIDAPYVLSVKALATKAAKVGDVHLNKDGKVVNKLADPEHNVAEDPALINLVGSKAEAFQFAVVSADGQVRAFTRIIPFPIESSAGPCHLNVEEIMLNFAAVLITVTGLQPNETVEATYKSEKKGGKLKDVADAKGTYSAAVATGVKGKSAGIFEFQVAAQSCKIGIEFPWGEGSMKAQ
jgi:hypothetical protein